MNYTAPPFGRPECTYRGKLLWIQLGMPDRPPVIVAGQMHHGRLVVWVRGNEIHYA